MKNILPLSLTFLLALVLCTTSSCKRKKKNTTQVTPDTTSQTTVDNCHMDRRAPKSLIASMRSKEFDFVWMSAKLNCEASDDSSTTSFNVMLRMKKDSAIWMNVTDPVIGISVARAYITRDSVKFMQFLPQQKCFAGDFAILSSMLQIDVDFDMMQSLLIGNSASFYEEDEKLKSSVNEQSCNYVLSTIRKRKLKKALEAQKPPDDPFQTISLDPSTFKIMRILFVDAKNRTFTADYSEFSKEDTLSFPHHEIFFGRSESASAQLDVVFKRITLNQPLEFPFSFPDDCKPIILKQGPPENH
ncbi:MAG: DUF4292 domain-containing protein [Bacteroidetes bacterium]|nr:DUF4292 domain-containing protein [Bacteroidota bacterium]